MGGRIGAAVVVGGSGGIGAGIVAVLARAGWDIAITFRRRADRAGIAARQAEAAGARATVHAVDLAEDAAVAAMLQAAVSAHGVPGCIVYAAGPLVPQVHLSRTRPEQMRDHLIQDTLGFFHLVHAAIPLLRQSRGSLVACMSAAQFRYAPADGLSVVPKAGVMALMQGVAREEGRHGIRANGVAIGLIEAGQREELGRLGQIDAAYLAAAARATPLRRAGRAEDVGEAVAFLADPDRAGFVTGTVIRVDGGYSV